MAKTLNDILRDVDVLESKGDLSISISGISFDTRHTKKGDIFVPLTLTAVDRHAFIDDAINAGAVAVFCERFPEAIREGIVYIRVENLAHSMAMAAKAFYDDPSTKLTLVGVTGTNGKTTTATLLSNLFTGLGYKTGLISTAGDMVAGSVAKTERLMPTTPDAVSLNALLREMLDSGCTHAFMEVSSHAVVEERVAGITFAGGIFTNLTQDHLDYHGTMEAYAKAKQGFFMSLPGTAFALSNSDDGKGRYMLEETSARKYFYSLVDTGADFFGELSSMSFDGVTLRVQGNDIHAPLIGKFNAYNLLAVYGAALLLGETPEKVIPVLATISLPKGRFEYIRRTDGAIGVVDYAHSPDAVENVLNTLRELTNGKIITVIGCGGDRDPFKRPIMGNLAHDMSDYSIFTADNPRTESLAKILEDMTDRLPDDGTWETVPDRREAINRGADMAAPGDIILIAGKGHEDYQIVGREKMHFSDIEEVTRAFGVSSPT